MAETDVEIVCPKCKSAAECFCRAGGRNGDYDEFILVCSRGHTESCKIRIGSLDSMFGSYFEAYPACPYCGKNHTKHKALPVAN